MPEHTQIEQRLRNLENHLKEENDILYDVVQSFRDLDQVAYELGVLDPEQSYATRVSWWPMISVLGMFSAGKSTFLNDYIGKETQRTGNQAVDDKFTVLTYSAKEGVNTLPGIALDADPRFPFYQISRDIQEIMNIGGQRIDAYLQLKTCPSEALRGRILIDSPGFDADSQRTATLRITRHIIDLSDLVLVFFDARHPEPGAMHDTLQHLVSDVIDRPDANKFLYILNQIDVTAREDNPEEVVAAWQRSLAQAGLTAGRFYRIYNPKVAFAFENEQIKARFEKKRKEDIDEIELRMSQVSTERAYRIIGVLEHTAQDLERRFVPQMRELIQRWKRITFRYDMIVLVLLAILGAGVYGLIGGFTLPQDQNSLAILGGIAVVVLAIIHLNMGGIAARNVRKSVDIEISDETQRESLQRAFDKNATFMRTLFMPFIGEPVGWGEAVRKVLEKVKNNANEYVQKLNDSFTNPAG